MAVFEVSGLPQAPSAAAAEFHAKWLPRTMALLKPLRAGQDLIIAFDAADYTHTAWRLASIQALAREHAPARVNAISGGDQAARQAAVRYLAVADGVTGQVLQLDDAGAGAVVEPAQ